MKVSFYATLRQVVGSKEVDFELGEGATVRMLIDEMIRCYPDLQRELLDKQGNLYQHVHVFVNGRDASFLENGLDTPLDPEDVVGIFPAVGGGCERSCRPPASVVGAHGMRPLLAAGL